ncbi:efflux RND transporter periplasmic adaptor subunit [Fundidesulfovibrio soli]|uniref:efflux RND transporter periplasmic adaptor subunit n=1 Tax=Fundidesulfovibrio soli TaxID=2922716 RepID=UPI001FAE793F
MRHLLLPFVAVFLLFNSAVVHSQTTKPSDAPPPPDVEVVAVTQKDVPIYGEWVASLDGLINASIRAQVQGYLVKQNYKEGDFVAKGTTLFEIDPRPFEATVSEAKAVLAKYEAVLRTHQATLKRILPLAAAKALSQKDKDDATGAVQAAEAQVLAAKASLQRAQLDLDFCKIASPIDGIAGISQVQIGDLVGTQQNSVLTTVSTVNPIKAYISISEAEYLGAAQKKGSTQVAPPQIPLELILADGTTWKEKGRVSFADRHVDPSTGTLKVAALFPNPDNFLRPGQFAKVRALTQTQSGALLVPQRAVSELQGKYQVAVVDQNNVVHIKQVKVGERVDQMWMVLQGLKPGDLVVSEGLTKIRDGIVVNPKVKK